MMSSYWFDCFTRFMVTLQMKLWTFVVNMSYVSICTNLFYPRVYFVVRSRALASTSGCGLIRWSWLAASSVRVSTLRLQLVSALKECLSKQRSVDTLLTWMASATSNLFELQTSELTRAVESANETKEVSHFIYIFMYTYIFLYIWFDHSWSF